MLPTDSDFEVFTPSPTGIELVRNLFSLSTRYKVENVLGGDTVRYKGMISELDTGLSVWTVQLFGGMTICDTQIGYRFKNSYVAMISGNRKSLEKLGITELNAY